MHTVALHDAQEFDDNFGGRTDEDLALATTLGVDNVVLQRILLVRLISWSGDR
jgi:hypothetical protein